MNRLQLGDTCIHGHFLDEDTLYVRPNGKTSCKKCAALARKRLNSQHIKYTTAWSRINKIELKLIRNGVAAGIKEARNMLQV